MLEKTDQENRIWMTPQLLSRQAGMLQSAGKRILYQAELTDQYLEMLSEAWKGEDAGKEMKKGKEIAETLRKNALDLQKLSEAMDKIAKTTSEAEQKNQNLIG